MKKQKSLNYDRKLTEKELRAESLEFDDTRIIPDLNITVRKAIDDTLTKELTPQAIASKLSSARAGDTQAFIDIVNDCKEKDLNSQAAIDSVVEKAMSRLVTVEPGSTSNRDKEIADAVRTLISSSNFKNGFMHQLCYSEFGFAASYLSWQTDVERYTPVITPLLHQNFTFSKVDGRTLLLRPAVQGGALSPLDYSKFVVTMIPGAGLPYLKSDGFIVAKAVALKKVIEKAMISTVAINGQPFRVGKLPNTSNEKQLLQYKKILRNALENIGNDAWAILSHDMEIEFKDAITSSHANLYLDPIRYLDEQVTKKITGSVLATGTGNTGSGGSQSLGTVHSSALEEKAQKHFNTVLQSMIECVIVPFIEMNFGPNYALPIITSTYPKEIPLETILGALPTMVDLGLEIACDDILARAGLRTPEAGEKILKRISATPAQNASTTGLSAIASLREAFTSTQEDEIDALISDYEQSVGADEFPAESLADGITFSALKEQLAAWVESGELSDDDREQAAAMIAAVSSAGQLGADVGGE